ncbi:MAG: protease inhibitor I42 family protein [Treponema sp.]|nr:protease inhibitor I42 family protein [Treponema sp.]
MKRKTFLPLIFLSLLFAGCMSDDFKTDTTKIELTGNPTTGYTWNYTLSDNTIIQVEEDIQYLGAQGLVGAPSRFVYTIKSQKPGTTSLKFEYKRPWETEAPEEVRLYAVTVTTDGKINVEEK